jgi:hypothetical protein
MSVDAQRLYDLLPAIYRIRDAEQGEPLKALLTVIADQVGVLEENVEQLYDDQFIETCAEWVVPYIGDLIGYRALHTAVPAIRSERAEVAHTIGFRRRKGTATMLEQLARDVTGWNARVVEFFQLLSWTQCMNHLRPTSVYAPDLRQWEALERLNTPFDTVAHTVDVRRIATGQGKHNIPNIGIFLWRLNAYSLTESPAVPFAPGDTQRFLFDPLGKNAPLYTRPAPEEEIAHLADPINVPNPISRRVLDEYLTLYYGRDKSIYLKDVDINVIESCNLSDTGGGSWAHKPAAGRIAIDPVLGRIAFGDAQSQPPLVTFHYGFSTEMGGGEYDRADTVDARLPLVGTVPVPDATIQGALDAVTAGGAVKISDSGRYAETLSIMVNAGKHIELGAVNKHRPTLALGGDLLISGGLQSEVTLNGLLIAGGALRVAATAGNQLQRLRLRHCTLVPGASPSLIVEIPDITVEIDHCIIGGLRIAEGASVQITDSIVDATTETGVACAHPDGVSAGGTMQIIDSTIIGKVHTREIQLASNTIFASRLAESDTWTAPVRSEKKQSGCMRFSYVPPGSRTPRRYRCQPDLEIAMRIDQAEKSASSPITQAQREAIRADVETWLAPSFTASIYGVPSYGQLRNACPAQIRTGADDEAEMGAFHKLYQPQRETNLRVRLEEYLRFGLEAGIIYVT